MIGAMGWAFLAGICLGIIDAFSTSPAWRWLLGWW